MAYTHGKQQIPLLAVAATGLTSHQLNISATLRTSRFVPITKTVVHAVGVVTIGSAAKGGVIKFATRATAGSSVTGGTVIATLTIASGTTSGKIVARKGLGSTVSLGANLGCYVSTAGTGVTVAPVAWVEEQPLDLANNTKVTLVTT